ncbi:MAG: extracellular solute-binding protein [Ruminococcaceae bacterium]|nr:extracellular solute-binding protein [Oscillospiraceae bacterium]
MRNILKLRLFSLVMSVVMLFGIFSIGITAFAENSQDTIPQGITANSYGEYLLSMPMVEPACDDIVLNAENALFTANDDISLNLEDSSLVWKEGSADAAWSFEVSKDAYYNIKLSYKSLDTGVNYDFGFMIDGVYPFDEAKLISFPRMWKNTLSEFKEDNIGNQLTPEQMEVEGYSVNSARDINGVVIEPYRFYLTAGTHTITVKGPGQSVALSKVILSAPEEVLSYKELLKSYDKKGDSGKKTIVIEAENAILKSSSKLIPKSDNSNAGMSPQDVLYTKLNYIGGTSWQEAGQYLEWKFNVEKAGYYSFGFRYRQSDVINAESWRWLKIDGKTPFEEAKGIRFPYGAEWQYLEFGSKNQPFLVWLDKGEHTVSLEVTMGAMSEYYDRLSGVVSKLGDKYIEIVKITGATPDINLDYELFNQIADLNSTFQECLEELEALSGDLKDFTGKRGSQYIAAINNMSRVLDTMIESPYIAHQYVTDYYTNYSSLSSWLYDMKNMPLCLDTIQVVPEKGEFDNEEVGFFEDLFYTLERLLMSFADDYIIESKTESKNSLTLWVNWGRDQATALDTLIRDSFTQEHNIPVNVRITNASLINGLLSGNFPDMALHLARTEPVNLGIRGALVDLNEMPGIENILERFQDGAQSPYSYNGKLYALPDTQNFQLMFYRTDIFESLGLTVPETWDEFLYTAAIIQRNNMNVYIPYTQIVASTTINAGIGSLNLFPTLMTQHGLSLYNDELNATSLNSVEATNVFDYWTDLYTKYDFQKEADFYNRFRVGIMPLGIAPYSTYLTLYSAAPEIKGRWAVACIPGVEGGNNYVAGAGTGCAIIKKSKNRDNAWKFLDWWTSAEAQTRYSNNVESLIGMLGRQQTANIEALEDLAWDKNDLEVIMEQWSRVKEVPEVPGSYYFGRALDQAFWSVINDGTNAKDAISKWSEVADDEIERKIKEYS